MTAIRTGIQLALVIFSSPLVAADAPTAASVTSLVYQCDDGKQITAVFDPSDPDHPKTTIAVAGDPTLQKLEMHDVISANGVKTSNGTLVWWTKGDEGFLAKEDSPTDDGSVLIGGCKEMSAKP